MDTKEQIIKDYREAAERFGKLMLPNEDTAKIIANELIAVYDDYCDWFRQIEEYAYSQGWYEELVK